MMMMAMPPDRARPRGPIPASSSGRGRNRKSETPVTKGVRQHPFHLVESTAITIQPFSLLNPGLERREVRGELNPAQVGHRVSKAYFDLDFRLKFAALQAHRRLSGFVRGVMYNQESHLSHRKHARSSWNAATTGSKSFLPKLAHSL